jgi:hypothetical protein
MVASFGNGVRRDEAARTAAIVSPWLNGQTEKRIAKLKLTKREMYGHGKIDLLQARLIGAAGPNPSAIRRQSQSCARRRNGHSGSQPRAAKRFY